MTKGSMTEEHKAAIREGRERRLAEKAAGKIAISHYLLYRMDEMNWVIADTSTGGFLRYYSSPLQMFKAALQLELGSRASSEIKQWVEAVEAAEKRLVKAFNEWKENTNEQAV